jgi:hypothetical protein
MRKGNQLMTMELTYHKREKVGSETGKIHDTELIAQSTYLYRGVLGSRKADRHM